jgi:HlyD family secretion protein
VGYTLAHASHQRRRASDQKVGYQQRQKLIAKEQNLKQTETQITNNHISSHNKRKELMELDKTIKDQKQKFRSALFTLKSRVDEWIEKYIVCAAENGRLEFISFMQENQLISAGQQLFFIQPGYSDYYAEMKAGQSGFGKIKTGQKVIIRLDGYPDAEFGHITGAVSYISTLPNDRDSFLVKVDLPDGLKTNFNKTIYFRNNLSASVEVITDNRSLADRFFGELNKILKR